MGCLGGGETIRKGIILPFIFISLLRKTLRFASGLRVFLRRRASMSKTHTEMLRRQGRKAARKARFAALEPADKLSRKASRLLAKTGFFKKPVETMDADPVVNRILTEFTDKQAGLVEATMIGRNGGLRRPF
jgi:hypothetical protein